MVSEKIELYFYNFVGYLSKIQKGVQEPTEDRNPCNSNDKQPKEYQVTLLLHIIGNDPFIIYNGFMFTTDEDQQTITKIIAKFEEFAVGVINKTYKRYVLNQSVQEQCEGFDKPLGDLREPTKSSNFCMCVDSVLRDRNVTAIRNKDTQKALLKEYNLELRKTIDICKSMEKADADCNSDATAGEWTFEATLSYEEDSKEECIYVIKHQSTLHLSRRAAPILNEKSPAELLMGRRLNTATPVLPKTLQSSAVDQDDLQKKRTVAKWKQNSSFNQRHRAKEQPRSNRNGTEVFVRDRNKYGLVTQHSHNPCSVFVEEDGGTILLHNRSALVPTLPQQTEAITAHYYLPRKDCQTGTKTSSELSAQSIELMMEMLYHDNAL
ncbi:hypothetical protein CAPTEDRAFT_193857 [Capitella teleta]|uniref:Uncharacterized protein n=1 Tax=Capitella teleta TaxID=283909 RepID=R7UXZ6_CAPTE|nr:hypothetical protein CAPTEDRAFT_193857 [Capitella teleta]|eukprot:ELU11453.1 hypothetical protein CAPTEDRAFT_193857 [Capitella teleta]